VGVLRQPPELGDTTLSLHRQVFSKRSGRGKGARVKKDRVEAISDGVMAVAITLLVIDLDIDAKSSTPLATQLREQWPSFAAYVLSFFVIGTLWLNHHNLFRLATRIDRRIMVYNLLMLLLVAAIPFATKTYADYVLAGGANARMAVLLYGGILETTSLLFTLMVVHLVRARLTNPPLSSSDARRLVMRNTAGTFIGPALVVAGLIKPTLLLVFGICAVFYYIGPGLSALELRFSNPAHGSGPRMEQKRVEGFSDAVLVVAITIMVLYLNVDSHSPESLATQLRQQWPSFAAFALSFFVISTVWLQQQSLFRIATSIDQRMMVLNLVLLLSVVTIPFTTYAYADYVLAGGANARVGVMVASAAIFAVALSLSAMLMHIVGAGLLDPRISPSQARKAIRRYNLGTLLGIPAIAISLTSPILALPLGLALVGYYVGPGLHAVNALRADREALGKTA